MSADICLAKLDNGSIVNYDACCWPDEAYPEFHFIGEGVIYEINGVLQNDLRKRRFYRFEKDKNNE